MHKLIFLFSDGSELKSSMNTQFTNKPTHFKLDAKDEWIPLNI